MILLALVRGDIRMKRALKNEIVIPTQLTSLIIYENSGEKDRSSKSFK